MAASILALKERAQAYGQPSNSNSHLERQF